jgi:hypothetical protein
MKDQICRMRALPRVGAALLAASAACAPAWGVIFYSTADQTFNTSAPTGSLAGSGSQWVGSWDGFQAAPIAPNYFLAAHHIGGSVGDTFTLNGVNYTTTAYFDDSVSDLRIWQVSGTFPSWAPIYRGSSEVGQSLIVFGRGLSRGSAVTVDGVLKGWQWGSGGGTLRWGQNSVYSVVDGGSYWGSLLYALFQAQDPITGNPNEAHLAVGDSSGPVFINDGSGWKLAGVAAAVDGPFNTTNSGSGFDAALFDASGLYFDDDGTWVLVPGPGPVPSGFYATRVSVRASWIDSIAPQPPTDTDTPVLSGPQTMALALGLLGIGAYVLRLKVQQGLSS